MFNIGPWELALILLVALIVVGPGKLPEVAKSIGKGINEFKKVTSGYKKELQDAMDGVESPVKSYSYEAPVEKKEEAIQKEDPILNMANSFEATVLEKKEEAIQADTVSAPVKEQ
jgi:sec-independent protein translocase protein TatA